MSCLFSDWPWYNWCEQLKQTVPVQKRACWKVKGPGDTIYAHVLDKEIVLESVNIHQNISERTSLNYLALSFSLLSGCGLPLISMCSSCTVGRVLCCKSPGCWITNLSISSHVILVLYLLFLSLYQNCENIWLYMSVWFHAYDCF